MTDMKFISADSHIFEPPDLWTDRIDPKFKDRAPKIVREDGTDWWVCEGYRMTGAIFGAGAGRRFERPEEITLVETFDNVRPGGYDPLERLKDMDLDGMDVDVLYTTAGFRAMDFIADSRLLEAVSFAYNDWLADFCSAAPERLIGVPMVGLDDIDWGVRELQRSRSMGLMGAMIPTGPPEDAPYSSTVYDPFWAAAQDLRSPLGFHLGARRPYQGQTLKQSHQTSPPTRFKNDHWVSVSLAQLIYSGVFERFPNLSVGSVEFELGWVPFFLERLDYDYLQNARLPGWPRFKDDKVPSDFYRSNVFGTFIQGDVAVRLRDMIGVDSMMWGSDYPHVESTFPRSRQVVDEMLADCTDEEKAKMVGGNAARLYGLS